MNFLAGAGLASDAVSNLGNLVISGLHFANQQKVQAQQMQILSQQLDLSRQQLEINKLTQDPVRLMEHAMLSGFDAVSARQLAGSREQRILGSVSLPALDFSTFHAMTTPSRYSLSFVNQAMRTQPGSEPVLTGYRPLASRSPSIASTVNYDDLPWNNRPNFGTVNSLSSVSSTYTSSSLPSTVNYDSLPWKNRPFSV
uniref:Minor structural protein n=2 Tax=unclassified Sapovirus TaxID=371833 RepID=A0AAU7E4V6_9CALI